MMIFVGITAFITLAIAIPVAVLAMRSTAGLAAAFRRQRRLLLAGGVISAVVAIPVAANTLVERHQPAPSPVADRCEIVAPNGIVIPACGPGLYGGSVSPGAPSQGLITLKNWCNLVIGGCSSAFYYPQGPGRIPEINTSVRHHP